LLLVVVEEALLVVEEAVLVVFLLDMQELLWVLPTL
jgi:hypothetical protein